MTALRIEQIEGDSALAARKPIEDAIDTFNDRATGLTKPAERLALAMRDPDTNKIKGGPLRRELL